MQWATPASRSYVDEIAFALLSLPVLLIIVQFLRGDTSMIQALIGGETSWLATGWGIILAAMFGANKVTEAWNSSAYSGLGEAMAKAEDSIPADVVADIHEKLNIN